jgi:hypothetical protein
MGRFAIVSLPYTIPGEGMTVECDARVIDTCTVCDTSVTFGPARLADIAKNDGTAPEGGSNAQVRLSIPPDHERATRLTQT